MAHDDEIDRCTKYPMTNEKSPRKSEATHEQWEVDLERDCEHESVSCIDCLTWGADDNAILFSGRCKWCNQFVQKRLHLSDIPNDVLDMLFEYATEEK